jgi:hypothetical protein
VDPEVLRRRRDRNDLDSRGGRLNLDFDFGFLSKRDVARADEAGREGRGKHDPREATTNLTLNKGQNSHGLAPPDKRFAFVR